MASSWLRLWHDMPNDPKWRTIARISGQPISLVQAVFIHILVDASRNVTRGHTTVTQEDMASALDVTEEQIVMIIDAMQGRVIDGDVVSGWENRQPKREDFGDTETGAKSAAERKRAQREREKEHKEEHNEKSCHDMSHDVTIDTDTDTDKEEEKNPSSPTDVGDGWFDRFWQTWPSSKRKVGKAKCLTIWKQRSLSKLAKQIIDHVSAMKASEQWQGGFEPAPMTYLSQRRWEDGGSDSAYSTESLAVIEAYNAKLPATGWPEATVEPYSDRREKSIHAFLTFSAKPNFPATYFRVVGETLRPLNGCGLDWLLQRETFLKVKEGVIGHDGAAA